MAPAPTHFARRILLVHSLLLIAVLAVVALASGGIYNSTRNQVLNQAKSRQLLLVDQTVHAIENYYQSIFDNLELVHRAENEESGSTTESSAAAPQSDRSAARQADQVPAWRSPLRWGGATGSAVPEGASQFAPFNRNGLRAPGGGGDRDPASLVSGPPRGRVSPGAQILWLQLQGRVASLFWVNRLDDSAAGEHNTEVNPSPPLSRRVPAIQLIGKSEGAPTAEDEVARDRTWLASVHEPAVGPYQHYKNLGREFGGAGGANLIAIPYPPGRLLVAVVPIRPVQDKFLRTLRDGLTTDALLIDPQLTVMSSSRPTADGARLRDISELDARSMAIEAVQRDSAAAQLSMPAFTVGHLHFTPSLVSTGSLKIADSHWELLIASPLSSINEIVASLLHRALLWGALVVLSVGCILVSTTWRLIRIRTRLEHERHEILTRELNQAREIQLAWLPAHPPTRRPTRDHPPLPDVAALNIPANHISGDFYNWFELPDGRLVVTIGDVTGHGMSAAFLMATTQLLVRNTLPRLGDPGRCLAEVNEQLCVQVFNGQFVTMLIVVLDLVTGEMEIGNAGHPPPLIADGESFQPLNVDSQIVLGVERGAHFATQRRPLPPGASLLLYTDGVVDCISETGTRLGAEALRRALYGRYPTAQTLLDGAAARINAFRNNCELADDLTLVAIQLPPAPVSAAPPVVHTPRRAPIQP